jgi:hypothetical protein
MNNDSEKTLIGTLTYLLALTLLGCGDIDAATENDPGATPGTAGNPTQAAGPNKSLALALAATHKLPTVMSQLAYQGRSMAVSGIYTATMMSGMAGYGVVTTGTLTQTVPGVLQFSYSPAPKDRMVIVLADGKRHELTITKVQGNPNAATPEAFLAQNHALAYRHVVPGEADLQLETVNVNGQWTSSAKGSFTLDNQKYDTDVQAFGTYLFQNDMSGTENKTNYTLKGKVSNATFSIDINETHYFHLISAKGSKVGPVTHSVDTNENTLTIGGESYRWVNCSTKKVFKGGQPSASDPWAASGTVLRNGQPFGTYRYVARLMTESGAQRQFQLVTRDGTYVMESWNDYL